MTCGAGLIQRADGSIIVDGFTLYPIPFQGSAPGQTLPPGAITPKQGPVSITLGKSITDNTPICIETDNGSHCIPLKTIRSFTVH